MARKNNSAKIYASVFAALGDEVRLSLVGKLSQGQPRTISQLTEGTKLTRQAITKHLRVLENVGLVQSSPSGRENFFELVPDPLDDAKTYLDGVSKQWDSVLARLKLFAENT